MSARGPALSGVGSLRLRRGLALAGCGVLSIGLTACESTEQESARIGRESSAAATEAKPAHAAHARGHATRHATKAAA